MNSLNYHLLKPYFLKTLLVLSLLAWAVLATYIAFTKEEKVTLIAIDQNGARIVTTNEDPIYKTETVEFFKFFIGNLYTFDSVSFFRRAGKASEYFSDQFWEKEKSKLNRIID